MQTVTSASTIPLAAELDAYSIEEFCRRHSISRGSYYNLRAAGTGPREKRVMTRVLISKEAALEWRQGKAQAAATKVAS
jgi:hypothetical protein